MHRLSLLLFLAMMGCTGAEAPLDSAMADTPEAEDVPASDTFFDAPFVACGDRPDLVVVDIPIPSTYCSSAVPVAVMNRGTVAATGVVVRAGYVDRTDIVGTTVLDTPLEPGETRVIDVNTFYSGGLRAQSTWAEVDPDDAIVECTEPSERAVGPQIYCTV